MKDLGGDLKKKPLRNISTFAKLWKVVRADGVKFGFSDHDSDISIDDITYMASSSVNDSDAVFASGLSVGGQEVYGVLSLEGMTERDLVAGLWDGAIVELWLVNWSDLSERIHQATYVIGEVTRSGSSFCAELRSSAHFLDQTVGRIYQHRCDANLGDERCRVNLESPNYQTNGYVVHVEDDRILSVTLLNLLNPAMSVSGFFDRGMITFISGENRGCSMEIKLDFYKSNQRILELWHPVVLSIAPRDAFKVTIGCDKRFETCHERFANASNFRGFPHMPGTDHMLSSVDNSEPSYQGKPLVP